MAAGALCALASAGCERWHEHSSENSGKICFRSLQDITAAVAAEQSLEPVQLAADAALTVYVVSGECMSACDRHSRGSCTLQVDGDQLHLTSKFVWEEPDDDTCTLQCIKSVVSCESEPLPAGNYTLTYGDQRMALSVPGEVSGDCQP
jgi:hypothetical protein